MKVIFADKARKAFLKLDKPIQKQIQKFVFRLQKLENPRAIGKGTVENLAGHWRYRVGDYRLVCSINDDILEILVVKIGYRREVYKR